MADTTISYSARDRGELARFRCAGATRYMGFGCLRTDERCAASVGHSDRISECRDSVRPQLLRDSTDSGWEWRHFCSTCKSSCWSGFRDAGLHILRTLARWYSSRLLPTSRSSWILSTKFQRGPSDSHQTDGYHLHRRWSELLHETRDTAESTKAVYPRLRGRRTRKFKSLSGEGAECEEGIEAPTTKRDRGPASEASVPSRIPGNGARSHGRFRWQVGRPRSQWGCSRPDALHFEPCDVGNSCCLAKDKQPSVTRGSHSASSRRRQSHSQTSQLARSHQKAKCLLANLSKYSSSGQRPRSSRSVEEEFGVDPGVATMETELTDVLHGGGSGRGGVQRLNGHAQVQRIPRIRHECPGVIETMAHETRAGVTEDQHLLHHCGHFRTLQRVNGSTRCCARSMGYANLQRRTVATTWGWPLLGLSDPDARPNVHWSPAEASAVTAWCRRAAALGSSKKQLMTPDVKATPKFKSELPSDDDDNLQKQIRAAVKRALQAKLQGQGIKGTGGAN